MVGKAKWFTRRRYTGWGLMPKTWQGLVYIMAIAGVIAFIQALKIAENLKLIFTAVWVILILVDVLHVMASMKLDEREQKIEAIAERNAAWAMIASIAISILYVTTVGKELTGTELMPALIFPLVAGVIVKAASNVILDRKGI